MTTVRTNTWHFGPNGPWNNLWYTNYSSVQTNTRFTVVDSADPDEM